jgi:hypothetical protein
MSKRVGFTPKKISDLFDSYKTRFAPPQKTVEDLCFELITSKTRLPVIREHITYTVSTRTLYIQAPALVKSELRHHHAELIKEFKNKLGVTHSPRVIL